MNYTDLIKYPHMEPTMKPNYKNIPVTVFGFNDKDIAEFNVIYRYLYSRDDIKPIIRTRSGGISYDGHNFRGHCWDIRELPSVVEITLCCWTGYYRFQFRANPNTDIKHEEPEVQTQVSGTRAFSVLKKELLQDGINLDDYAIDNGQEVNDSIQKPIIKMQSELYCNHTFNNVHHIDIHSAWPAGIAEAYPEMAITWNRIYNKRKENPIYKQILNKSIGVMHSSIRKWKWANLAKAGIEGCNIKIKALTRALKANGNVILSYNTDGIWYMGDVYHGEGEGNQLGQWHNDHINCQFRAKSAGAYEYIENGQYKAVVRGKTKLDEQLPRSAWKWGDIYQEDAQIQVLRLIPGEGLINIGGQYE